MSYRNHIFSLVREYLPHQKLTGKGITLKYLGQLLIDHGINPNNPPVIQENYSITFFPIGIPEVDTVTMLAMDDKELLSKCSINKYVNDICNSNEFWRRRLSNYIGIELVYNLNYKEEYKFVKEYGGMIWAARNGHLNVVKYLVDNGANIHAKNDEALVLAAIEGHLDVVKYLVEHGADMRSRGDYALRLAARNGHFNVVEYLVENGADIHAKDDALTFAAMNGHLDVVNYLVGHGADIHAYDDEALRWAAENGHLNVVKYLVKNGAYIHAQDDEALRWAADNGHLDVVKYLVYHGANIDAYGGVALVLAASSGHLDVVEYLVDNGADIHDDAIKLASQYGCRNVVKYLKRFK